MNPRPIRIVGDLSDLPRSASGSDHLIWWGNFGFMLIEGMVFLLAAACCFYLIGVSSSWPPPGDAAPDLLWGTIFTLALLASEVANLVLLRASLAKQETAVRWLSALMTVLVTGLLAVRAVEFGHLNADWTRDAYGAVVWMLMVLHTVHLVTELGETVVLSIWSFTHEMGDDQFADMEDDANYWTFVVVAWLPIYTLVYWVPRWL